MNSQTLRGVPLNFQQQTPSGLLRNTRGGSSSYRAPDGFFGRERPEESVRYTSTSYPKTQQQTNYGYYSNLRDYQPREDRYVSEPSPAKRVATDNYSTEKEKEYPPNFHNYFQENHREAALQINLQEAKKIAIASVCGFLFTSILVRIANFFLGNGFVTLKGDDLFRVMGLTVLLLLPYAYLALPFEYRIHYRFYTNLIFTNSLRYKRLGAYAVIAVLSCCLFHNVSLLCTRTPEPSKDAFNNTLGVFVTAYLILSLVVFRSGLYKHKTPLTTVGLIIRSVKPARLFKHFITRNLLLAVFIVLVAFITNFWFAELIFQPSTLEVIFGKGRFEHLRRRDIEITFANSETRSEVYSYIITTWLALCQITFTLRVYKKFKAQTIANLGYISRLSYPLFVYGLINPRDPRVLRASLDYLTANLRLESRRSLSSSSRALDSYKDSLQIFFDSVLSNLKAINLALEKIRDYRTYYRNSQSIDNVLLELRYTVFCNPREEILNQYYEQINIAKLQIDVAAQCFVTMRLLEGDNGMLKYDLVFKDLVEQITACREKLELFESSPELCYLHRPLESFRTALHEAIEMLQVYMKRDIRSVPTRIVHPDSSFAYRDY